MSQISYTDFEKVDIRTGKIIDVEDFPEARNPAYKMQIDFGPLGIKKTSAQITGLYNKDDLKDKTIIAVINFPPKQIHSKEHLNKHRNLKSHIGRGGNE